MSRRNQRKDRSVHDAEPFHTVHSQIRRYYPAVRALHHRARAGRVVEGRGQGLADSGAEVVVRNEVSAGDGFGGADLGEGCGGKELAVFADGGKDNGEFGGVAEGGKVDCWLGEGVGGAGKYSASAERLDEHDEDEGGACVGAFVDGGAG